MQTTHSKCNIDRIGGIESGTSRRYLTRFVIVTLFSAHALSGCYVMPVGQDSSGRTVYAYSPVAPASPQGGAPSSAPVPAAPMAKVLNVKLYPANDLANQTGVLTGQVTNMMTGKGRFTFSYQGQTMVGEATRVANDKRRGIASAYGPDGLFAKCDYQMSNPMIGAGTCTFSNDAVYQVHIGN